MFDISVDVKESNFNLKGGRKERAACTNWM